MGILKGLSYPCGSTIEEFLRDKGDKSVIRSSILNILFTRRGERVMLPEFGSSLPDLVFEPNDEITEQELIRVVKDDVETWDPRIEIIGTQMHKPETNPNQLEVTVRYRMKKTSQEDTDEFTFSVSSGGTVTMIG